MTSPPLPPPDGPIVLPEVAGTDSAAALHSALLAAAERGAIAIDAGATRLVGLSALQLLLAARDAAAARAIPFTLDAGPALTAQLDWLGLSATLLTNQGVRA